MQPMHLQLHAINGPLQLVLIIFATIFHLNHSSNYFIVAFIINDFFILHSKILFIHDHAHTSHYLQIEPHLFAPLECQHNPW
jgi:hypothetical protein